MPGAAITLFLPEFQGKPHPVVRDEIWARSSGHWGAFLLPGRLARPRPLRAAKKAPQNQIPWGAGDNPESGTGTVRLRHLQTSRTPPPVDGCLHLSFNTENTNRIPYFLPLGYKLTRAEFRVRESYCPLSLIINYNNLFKGFTGLFFCIQVYPATSNKNTPPSRLSSLVTWVSHCSAGGLRATNWCVWLWEFFTRFSSDTRRCVPVAVEGAFAKIAVDSPLRPPPTQSPQCSIATGTGATGRRRWGCPKTVRDRRLLLHAGDLGPAPISTCGQPTVLTTANTP